MPHYQKTITIYRYFKNNIFHLGGTILTIRKEANGMYVVDVSAGTNPATNRRLRLRKHSIPTLKEAKKIEYQLSFDIAADNLVLKTNISMETLSKSFFKEIENFQKNHIFPLKNTISTLIYIPI